MAKAKKIGYVVMQIGWEYNDEYYYRPDCEGGKPVKVFNTQKEAQAERDRFNNHSVHENEHSGYPMTDQDDKAIANFYEVVEVELA